MSQYQYKELEKNLQDLIAEEQAKLGYRQEAIRLYYPLSSLNHLLIAGADAAQDGKKTKKLSAEEMQKELELFARTVQDKFGNIAISHKKERFCFFLPEQATQYVHDRQGENAFIYELVALLAQHDTTMEDIIHLFEKQADPCEVININNEEFDTLIRFIDSDDRYFYCFSKKHCSMSRSAKLSFISF